MAAATSSPRGITTRPIGTGRRLSQRRTAPRSRNAIWLESPPSSSIARRHDCAGPDQLARANGLRAPYVIRAGQRLQLKGCTG